jgi:hypothetical protein
MLIIEQRKLKDKIWLDHELYKVCNKRHVEEKLTVESCREGGATVNVRKEKVLQVSEHLEVNMCETSLQTGLVSWQESEQIRHV